MDSYTDLDICRLACLFIENTINYRTFSFSLQNILVNHSTEGDAYSYLDDVIGDIEVLISHENDNDIRYSEARAGILVFARELQRIACKN